MSATGGYSALLGLVLFAFCLASCGDDDDCDNGTCVCEEGETCDFECENPPCHVHCDDDSSCDGTCANGDCRCSEGASCDFGCLSGPCHVKCEGDNPECSGTCANGTCTCGPGSSCHFACKDANCHFNCLAGASCLLECPGGGAGESCDFSTCEAGESTPCAGGTLIACGRACP